jgi:type IX secretion system PorP/SprF family membrane protein
MKKIVYIIPLLTLLFFQIKAQDIHFSQFYETAILRNPALIGIFADDYKVVANYRTQWGAVSQPFVTQQLCFEGKIITNPNSADFFSYGLLANMDKAGSLQMSNFSAYPSISFNKSLEDVYHTFLSVGFTGGYAQRSFDPSKITTNNQYQGGNYDPNASNGEGNLTNKLNYLDLGVGINFSGGAGEYNQTSYFIGVSAYHLTKPKNSFFNNNQVNLDTRYTTSAGLTYRFADNYGLMLQSDYRLQGKFQELLFGGLLNWKKPSEYATEPLFVAYIGCFYRLNDAIIPVVKVDYMCYSLGLSYDVNLSKLSPASNMQGGLEISLVKTGMYRQDVRGKTLCPHFFY